MKQVIQYETANGERSFQGMYLSLLHIVSYVHIRVSFIWCMMVNCSTPMHYLSCRVYVNACGHSCLCVQRKVKEIELTNIILMFCLSIFPGLQKLARVSSVAGVEATGNVHSGGPPPWFSSTDEKPSNEKPRSGLSI